MGTVKALRLVMHPEINASMNISFIRVNQNLKEAFYVAAYHTYRLSVQGESVALYIDSDNNPIIQKSDWLAFSTSEKSIVWGKTNRDRGKSSVAWQSIKFYTDGALSPVIETYRDWSLSAMLSKGSIVKMLQRDRTKLFALVDPVTTAIETTDPNDLLPRVWVLPSEESLVWGDPEGVLDSLYAETCATVICSAIWKNRLFTGTENIASADDLRDHIADRFDIVSVACNGTDIELSGNVYRRMKTHAYDDILQDTTAPVSSIIINEDEATGGIRVHELVVYYSVS
jgi:hypothetical protein